MAQQVKMCAAKPEDPGLIPRAGFCPRCGNEKPRTWTKANKEIWEKLEDSL